MGRKRNPLLSYHERDREPYARLIQRASGSSEKTANRIAQAFPSGYGIATATKAALRQLGATAKQADRLEAAFELCREAAEGVGERHGVLREPADVASYIQRVIGPSEQERFIAILLDSRQKVIDARELGRGSLAQVDLHPRELFRDAIRLRAHSLILAHNHPSGDPEPSKADFELTERMVETGKLVGIPVLDHLVTTDRDFVSLAERGHVTPPS